MSSIDTAPFPAVDTAAAEPAPHSESRGHSPASLHQAGPMMRAHREISKVLAARSGILPGLDLTNVGADGHISFMYVGVAGSETTASWTSPDGVLATWRSLLTQVTEAEEFVDRTVTIDGESAYVQDRVTTLRGRHGDLPVTVLLTAAGMPQRRAS